MSPERHGAEAEHRITEAVAQITERRAVIEQAKGMLMMLHGLDQDQAFALLVWRSQETNCKLRDLAEQLVVDFRSVSADHLPPRSDYDRLLMTAHQRLPAGDEPRPGVTNTGTP